MKAAVPGRATGGCRGVAAGDRPKPVRQQLAQRFLSARQIPARPVPCGWVRNRRRIPPNTAAVARTSRPYRRPAPVASVRAAGRAVSTGADIPTGPDRARATTRTTALVVNSRSARRRGCLLHVVHGRPESASADQTARRPHPVLKSLWSPRRWLQAVAASDAAGAADAGLVVVSHRTKLSSFRRPSRERPEPAKERFRFHGSGLPERPVLAGGAGGPGDLASQAASARVVPQHRLPSLSTSNASSSATSDHGVLEAPTKASRGRAGPPEVLASACDRPGP